MATHHCIVWGGYMKTWALQTAIYTRLIGYTPLTDIVGTRIFDHVEQDVTFPYLKIGEETTTVSWDTHDSKGADHTVVLHSWSRYRGMFQTKSIQNAIYDALHRYDLAVTGADTVTSELDLVQSFLDDDGLTRHGVVIVRVILDGV